MPWRGRSKKDTSVTFIGERQKRIVNTGDTNHVMTNNVLGNQSLITPVAKFVKRNSRNGMQEPKPSATMSLSLETSSGNSSRHLVAVSLPQNATSATWPSLNTSSDDEAEDSKAHCKRKSKKVCSNSSSNEGRERKHQKYKRK